MENKHLVVLLATISVLIFGVIIYIAYTWWVGQDTQKESSTEISENHDSAELNTVPTETTPDKLAVWIVGGFADESANGFKDKEEIKAFDGDKVQVFKLQNSCDYKSNVQVINNDSFVFGCVTEKDGKWQEYKIVYVTLDNNLNVKTEKVISTITHSSFSNVEDFDVVNFSAYSKDKWVVRINQSEQTSSEFVITYSLYLGKAVNNEVEYTNIDTGSYTWQGPNGDPANFFNISIEWSLSGNMIAYLDNLDFGKSAFKVISVEDDSLSLGYKEEGDGTKVRLYTWVDDKRLLVVKENKVYWLDINKLPTNEFEKIAELDVQHISGLDSISYNTAQNTLLISLTGLSFNPSVYKLDLNDNSIKLWQENAVNALWMGDDVIYVGTYKEGECSNNYAMCQTFFIKNISYFSANESKIIDDSVQYICEGAVPISNVYLGGIDAK